ncbi:IclR family transcriptional regulator C-terminal domain-containing protein [Salinisphaera sp. Q1T1-3]|uniref:IclR family transcriptional regulator domain-containing protein n=1 Tax=Salinisphaera sp. Q1T1-3 TaxID=2321229 RepID=UPI001F4077E0|nr:IclR family transcriptional regulator C-terminal domain-containing protein [Salinisphaera sp. Q1T1-3]
MFSSDSSTTPDDTPGPEHRDFVAALATGLDIIRAFDQHTPRMTLSEVAAKNGINRAKARRFLLTLHALGYVRKTDRYFELAPRTLDLGYAYLSANGYQDVIRQHLEHVTEVTGESSSMGTLDGDDVIYVARSAAPHRLMTVALALGSRLPAVATSMGRVLLATLTPEALETRLAPIELVAHTGNTITDRDRLREVIAVVRSAGYCIVDQELESGLRSLAVPVHAGNGRLLGALNVSTNAARVPRERLEAEFLPLLRETADQIGRAVN